MKKKAREGCKGNGNGDVWVAGNKEGKGSKAMTMAMATRMVGEWSATMAKRSMVTAMRVVGKQQQQQQRGQ